MRVLHVTLSLARGGRRTAILSLIDGLRKLGVDSDMCCVDALGCAPEEATQMGVRIEVLGRRSLFDRAALEKFRALCRDVRPEVIHAHDAGGQTTAAIARFGMKRIPLLMTFHRSRSNESATLLDRVRNALACTQSSAIVTGSRERREHFLSQNLVAQRKVIRIPFGTDLSRFYPDPSDRQSVRKELGIGPDEILVGVIGHFGPEKGVDIAIRSFQALAGRSLSRPVTLVIFGEGERRAELEKLIAGAPSPGPIRLAGFRPDIHRCMRALDIVLHTPRLEAFGLVIIESMATALPIVAARTGGIPDLVRHGETGLLAEPENPESFATALERLLESEALHTRLSQEARRVALDECGIDLYARRHLKLYEDLCAHREPARLPTGAHLLS
jgi:glycosyltransferase involved in cell wall biosynthesis